MPAGRQLGRAASDPGEPAAPAHRSGSVPPFARRTGAMTRHRTTARGVSLLFLTALLAAAVVASPGAAPKPGLVDGKPIVFPLIGDYAYTINYGDPRAHGRHAGIDIENVPWRTPGRRRRGGPGQVVDDLGARRLHALPLRQERHDIPLYPPQQRPDRGVGGQGRLQARRRVRGRGRREGDRRRADRVERRLGRRRGQPPPPLRGAPGRRRRREPVPVPQRRGAPPLPRPDRRVVLARRARRPGRRGRRDDQAPRDGGALVARRALDVARRRAPGRRSRIGEGRRRRHARSSPRSRARSGVPSRAAAAHVVTAYTAQAKVTAEALRGEPGALVAARVTRPGGDDRDDEAGRPAIRRRRVGRRRRHAAAGRSTTRALGAIQSAGLLAATPGRARCGGSRRSRSSARRA